MKALKKTFFFPPLLILLCGLYFVPSHKTNHNAPHFSVSQTSEKQHYFSKEVQHHSTKAHPYEIVEQTSSSFQKDLAGDSVFNWLTRKDDTLSFLNLLSKRLSLHKPFLITHSGEALYLVIRILRL